MATLNGLPVFKIKISEDLKSNTGIDFISLVDFPAIESNWVAMNNKAPIQMQFNADKKLIYGAFLIPDLPIYRYDEKQGEYYVVFTKEEIQKIVRKFQEQNKSLSLNYQHKPDSQVNAVIQEIWLTGKTDKSQDFGFNLPEGSGFAVTYMKDDKFWNEQVKTGNVKGYSIEGFLDMELKNQIKKYMSKQKFAEAKTTDGLTIKTDAETFSVGVDAVMVDADGLEKPAEGEYTLDNGTVIKCVAGKVTEMVEVMAEEISPEEQAALENLFAKIIKPLNDKIDALELKLSNLPGKGSSTEKTDEPKEVKLSASKIAFNKVQKIKQSFKK